jgi:hypothetical protein
VKIAIDGLQGHPNQASAVDPAQEKAGTTETVGIGVVVSVPKRDDHRVVVSLDAVLPASCSASRLY